MAIPSFGGYMDGMEATKRRDQKMQKKKLVSTGVELFELLEFVEELKLVVRLTPRPWRYSICY